MRHSLIQSITLGFALLSTANAATYYIDWIGGDDSNDGLSTNTAWKRAPRMKGYAGSHPIPEPGDRFIYKGGVTWPHSALKLRLTNSGTFASPIYYGIDTNYYTGGSWTRPVFDCESTVITDSGGTPQTGSLAAAILIDSTAQAGGAARNLVFEGIEVKNHRGHILNEGSFGASTICFNSGGVANSITNVTMRNMLVHDWSLRRYNAGDDTGDGGGATCINGVPAYVTIEDGDFYLSDPNAHSGSAIKSFASSTFVFRRNKVHDLSGGMVSVGGLIVSNYFYHIGLNGFGNKDDLAHENIIYDIARGTRVLNNIFFSNAPPCYYEGPSTSSSTTPYNTNTGSGITLIANNVMMLNSHPSNAWFGSRCGVNIDNESLSGGTSNGWNNAGFSIINNTIYADNAKAVFFDDARVEGYPNNKLGLLEIINNHVIANGAGSTPVFDVVDPSTTLVTGTWLNLSNVIQTVGDASYNGMTFDNLFRPQDTATPLYGAAVDFRSTWPNLTTDTYGATRDAAPDVGAYEYVEAPPSPPAGVIRITRFRVGQLLSTP